MKVRLRPTLDHVWLVLPAAFVFVELCLVPLREGDLWWLLKAGEWAVQHGQIPTVDVYTFTAAGRPYYFGHSWLAAVLLYLLSSLGGLGALVLGQAVLGVGIALLLLAESRRRGASLPLAAGTALLGGVSLTPFLTLRAQVFSFLIFAAVAYILGRYRDGQGNQLGLLPLLVAAQVNLHGAWTITLLLLGLAVVLSAAELLFRRQGLRRWWPLLAWSLAALAATLMHPYGWEIYPRTVAIAGSPISMEHVAEWQPIRLASPESWPLLALAALLAAGMLGCPQRRSLYDIVLALVFLALGVRYLRMLPFFLLLASPIVAGLFAGIGPARLRRLLFWKRIGPVETGHPSAEEPTGRPAPLRRGGIPALNAVCLGLALLVALGSLPQVRLPLSGGSEADLVDPIFPAPQADYIAAHARRGARIFNNADWGAYLTWRLYPQALVYVDGRVELFPLSIWEDYLRISAGDDASFALLDAYGVDYLVLDKERQMQLIAAAPAHGWHLITENWRGVLLARELPTASDGGKPYP